MKYDEAKRLIILEWDRWIQTQPIDSGNASGRDSLKFVLELQDARSALLNFQPKGRDKWRLIHAWLLSERRVAGGIGIHPIPRRSTGARARDRGLTAMILFAGIGSAQRSKIWDSRLVRPTFRAINP